jgi:hypothetical protein
MSLPFACASRNAVYAAVARARAAAGHIRMRYNDV